MPQCWRQGGLLAIIFGPVLEESSHISNGWFCRVNSVFNWWKLNASRNWGFAFSSVFKLVLKLFINYMYTQLRINKGKHLLYQSAYKSLLKQNHAQMIIILHYIPLELNCSS